MNRTLEELLAAVRACRACEAELPLGPRPVLRAHRKAELLVVGQAPGTKVHRTGIPWNDPSGDRLREWMNIGRDQFYEDKRIAIVPMGLCYPGKAERGDMPPRKECAELWFDELLDNLPNIRLKLLIGIYAQKYYLGKRRKKTLTETVRAYREYLPGEFPLPHPSPRNFMWQQKNPWFERDVIPALRERLKELSW